MHPIRSFAVKPLFLAAVLLFALLLPISAAAAGSEENVFYIIANGKSLTVQFADTAAARELDALLAAEDLTIDMTGNSFEQYGALGRRFSSNDTVITAQPGDVMLYKGDTVCVFYGANRYAYTRLGTVADADVSQLEVLLSGDDLTVTLTKQPGTESAAPDADTGAPDFMARLKALIEKISAFFRNLFGLFTQPAA